MNPTDANLGSIIVGLLIVMTLATAVYMLGVWAIANMRRGRVEDETTITYPDQPQSADDRHAVERIAQREQAGMVAAEELHERAVGRPMRPVSQTPDRIGERPVDADHDRGVAPRTHADGAAPAGDDRSPL